MVARRAVYTAILGGYERVLEQPVAASSELDFICFTDDPTLTSETWHIEHIRPSLPGDTVRSARVLKIRGHTLLGSYDETLWIDNTVLLTADPAGILNAWLDDADLAVPHHSFRESVADEFDVVAALRLEDPVRVYEQRAHYMAAAPNLLSAPALWTGMLARRHIPAVASTMEVWLDNVLRYSRRDQLSIVLAIAAAQHPVTVVEIDNNASQWHAWPRSVGRARGAPTVIPEVEQTLLARTALLAHSLEEQAIQLGHAVEVRERTIGELERELGEITASTSWRATAPLRAVSTASRRGVGVLRRVLRGDDQ